MMLRIVITVRNFFVLKMVIPSLILGDSNVHRLPIEPSFLHGLISNGRLAGLIPDEF